jgi:hypothetical protein
MKVTVHVDKDYDMTKNQGDVWQATSGLQIAWKCFPGRNYKVEASSTLTTASRSQVGANIAAGPIALTATTTAPVAPNDSLRFYRVSLLP